MAKKIYRREDDIPDDEDIEDEIDNAEDSGDSLKRRKKRKKSSEKNSIFGELKIEILHTVSAVISFTLMILSILAAFNKAGPIGRYVYGFLYSLFGIGYTLVPILFAMLTVTFLRGMEHRFNYAKAISALVFFLSALGLINLYPGYRGGIIGNIISKPLISLIDLYATIIVLIVLLVIALIVLFEIEISWQKIKNYFVKEDAKNKISFESTEKAVAKVEAIIKEKEESQKNDTSMISKDNETEEKNHKKVKRSELLEEDLPKVKESFFVSDGKKYTPPPLSLLEKDRGKPEVGDIKANANIIKRTLMNFGINVEMDEISIGPSVTRYALKPAEGVKISKIVGLNSDLSMSLAAHPLRIEAPIPGKSLVGIEIPNKIKTTVGLATLLASEDFSGSEKPLLVSLGKSISGNCHFTNIAKAPHMLVAGTTGSGKSVMIHTIITSLIYRNGPENLRFFMIDPKRVELTLYNGIPHLYAPVITDPLNTIRALRWAVREMRNRLNILEKNKVRDIDSYHKNVLNKKREDNITIKENGEEVKPYAMPYIVIVIDELADIMQTYPRELETAVVKLAQMARATGIHLILSTQRPSVNVITGLIKANIPTRIALQVASQIDSRTIIDTAGAEKLLGAGDMLFLNQENSKPIRLQSAYISESEVKRVVDYLIKQYENEMPDLINFNPDQENEKIDEAEEMGGIAPVFNSVDSSLDDENDPGQGLEDDKYEEAKKIIAESGKASVSFLQRRMAIGYNRAAKIMDMLEARKIVGPASVSGKKDRDVYIGRTNESLGDEDIVSRELPQNSDTELEDIQKQNE